MTASIGPLDWLRSVPTAARDLAGDRTRCVGAQLGATLTMADGRTYVPFRHTRKAEKCWSTASSSAVLHPRFRLPWFDPRRRWLHSLFRVVCIVTTPFFVGLPGFRSKLWMVDPDTGDFAGLYEWDDADTATAYAEGLGRVLRLLSVRGSVSYDVEPAMTVDEYLVGSRSAEVVS
jgi:hypothetical protein